MIGLALQSSQISLFIGPACRMNDLILPAYLADPPPSTEEEVWLQMQNRFDDLRDIALNCRIETDREALGSRADDPKASAPKWTNGVSRWKDTGEDPEDDSWQDDGKDVEPGFAVRPWNLIPFIKEIDQIDLAARQAVALQLAKALECQFAQRALSPEFMHQWGRFCAAAGALELVYVSQAGDVSTRRRASGKSLAPQKKWVAIQILDLMSHHGHSRASAEAAILVRIRAILEDPSKLRTFDDQWFLKIVKKGGVLNSLSRTFTRSGVFKDSQLQAAADADYPVPDTTF